MIRNTKTIQKAMDQGDYTDLGDSDNIVELILYFFKNNDNDNVTLKAVVKLKIYIFSVPTKLPSELM